MGACRRHSYRRDPCTLDPKPSTQALSRGCHSIGWHSYFQLTTPKRPICDCFDCERGKTCAVRHARHDASRLVLLFCDRNCDYCCRCTERLTVSNTGRNRRSTRRLLCLYSPLMGSKAAKINSSGPITSSCSRKADSITAGGRVPQSSSFRGAYGENYSGSGTTDLSFTGQNQDTVAGLHDFLFREYHPASGRWISPDPAGLAAADMTNPQSWSRYAYVGNMPLASVDPLGLDGTCDNNGNCKATGIAYNFPSWWSFVWQGAPVSVGLDQLFCMVVGGCQPPTQQTNSGGNNGGTSKQQPVPKPASKPANNGPTLTLKAESDCPDPNGNGRNIDYTLQDASGNPVSGYTVVEHQTDTSRASSAFGPGTSYQTAPPGTVSGFQDWLNPSPFQKPGNSI